MTIFPREFYYMCLSTFLFMVGFNLILPELNSYITQLGGSEYKAFSLLLFTFIAGSSRPFSGKLANLIGRKPLMYFGIIVSVICLFLYPLLSFLGLIPYLLIRSLHGLSTGFNPTGTTAFVADIIKPQNRGEAMGIFGILISLGTGVGNALGSPIKAALDFNGLFIVAGIVSLASLVFLPFVHETAPNVQKFKWNMLKINVADLFEKTVWLPTLVMFLNVGAFAVVLIVTPDHCESIGLSNKGVFVASSILSTIITRLFSGRLSDKYSRELFVTIGTALMASSIVYLIFAQTTPLIVIGGLIYGIGTGFSSPSLFAWVTDLTNDSNRSRGISTLFIGLEFGLFFGCWLTFVFYDTLTADFSTIYYYCFGILCLSLSFLLLKPIFLKR